MTGMGVPVVCTVKVPSVPTVKVVLSALVIAATWLTCRVKLCVSSGVWPLLALMDSGYVPAVPTSGVPARVAVPLLLSTKVTPLGSEPVSLMVIGVEPVVVTLKVPALPAAKVGGLALVTGGAPSTGRGKFCEASGATPLVASVVIG